MPVIVACTSCQSKLKLPDHGIGKKVKCPACATVFVAQTPDEPSAAVTTAPRPSAVPPPLPPSYREPPPLPDDEEAFAEEPLPRRKRARPRPVEDFKPVTFNVVVQNDPDKELKGTFIAKWTPDGLELKQGKQHDILIPVGTSAEHRKAGLFTVELDERVVQFNLVKLQAYHHRLTADMVAFLNGEVSEPDPAGYDIPWYLILVAALPVGIPILALGGLLPCAIGFGLAAANLAIVRQEDWPLAVRILLPLALSVVAYAVVIVLLVLAATARRW